VTATPGFLAPRMARALAAALVVLTRWSARGRAPEAGADDEIDEVDLAAVRRGLQGNTP